MAVSGAEPERDLSNGRKTAHPTELCSGRRTDAPLSLALVPAPFGVLAVPFGSEPPGDRSSRRARRAPIGGHVQGRS